MINAKQAVLEVVQAAPDDIGRDEVLELVFLKARVHEAQQAKAEGRFYTTDEMMARVFPCDTQSSG